MLTTDSHVGRPVSDALDAFRADVIHWPHCAEQGEHDHSSRVEARLYEVRQRTVALHPDLGPRHAFTLPILVGRVMGHHGKDAEKEATVSQERE
jgi:hypothetical protein